MNILVDACFIRSFRNIQLDTVYSRKKNNLQKSKPSELFSNSFYFARDFARDAIQPYEMKILGLSKEKTQFQQGNYFFLN